MVINDSPAQPTAPLPSGAALLAYQAVLDLGAILAPPAVVRGMRDGERKGFSRLSLEDV
jgi:hypothetical protein